jgi:hypothetical protein
MGAINQAPSLQLQCPLPSPRPETDMMRPVILFANGWDGLVWFLCRESVAIRIRVGPHSMRRSPIGNSSQRLRCCSLTRPCEDDTADRAQRHRILELEHCSNSEKTCSDHQSVIARCYRPKTQVSPKPKPRPLRARSLPSDSIQLED